MRLNFAVPKKFCNSHLHIIDPLFPNDGKAESQRGTIEEYMKVAEEFGMTRAVFVQAKPFGKDNRCLLDAIHKFGIENSRGIAVVDANVTDKELENLHNGGVRGLRFSVWNPKNAVVSFKDCPPLSERVKNLGWNVQLHMSSAQLLENADVIRRIKSKIVIDHMGRLNPELSIKDPAYKFIQELLDKGNTWVKLSGPYLNTCTGHSWDDATRTAIAIAEYAPERVVWGSDWPHVTEKVKPDEAELVGMISEWLPTEKARTLTLSENPEELYGFESI